MPRRSQPRRKPTPPDAYAIHGTWPRWRIVGLRGQSYAVRAAPWRCTCKSFAFGKGKSCKHIELVRALIVSEATEIDRLMKALSDPFDPSEVKFKPARVSGNRAMALIYVDARVVQDRLDEVLGVAGWQDDYEVLADNSVVCRLRLRLADEWVTKVDVGGPSEQPDGGDRMKAAFSDALKRAAVKFGVGRYLYRLPAQWCDYDPQKKMLLKVPVLPDWARPAVSQPAPAPSAKPAPAPQARSATAPPANGVELQQRLQEKDALLVKEGLCSHGELVRHVHQSGVDKGFPQDMQRWAGAAIQHAIDETKWFQDQRRRKQKAG